MWRIDRGVSRRKHQQNPLLCRFATLLPLQIPQPPVIAWHLRAKPDGVFLALSSAVLTGRPFARAPHLECFVRAAKAADTRRGLSLSKNPRTYPENLPQAYPGGISFSRRSPRERIVLPERATRAWASSQAAEQSVSKYPGLRAWHGAQWESPHEGGKRKMPVEWFFTVCQPKVWSWSASG